MFDGISGNKKKKKFVLRHRVTVNFVFNSSCFYLIQTKLAFDFVPGLFMIPVWRFRLANTDQFVKRGILGLWGTCNIKKALTRIIQKNNVGTYRFRGNICTRRKSILYIVKRKLCG